jgi:hypothetical protein
MTYQEKQNQLRQEALDFQFMSNNKDLSYSEIAEIQGYFYKKGKALGLLKEFRENGII